MNKDMVNVAHVINSLEYGGAEKVLINIANNENHSVIKPFVFSLSVVNPLLEELDPNVPFFFYKKCPVFDVLLVLKLCIQFKKQGIDIAHIHSWGVYPESFLAAYFAKVPTIILMDHGRVNIDGTINTNKTVYTKFKNFILSFFIDNTSAFIAVSNDIKTSMIEEMKVCSDKIFVIHNGIPSNVISNNKISVFIDKIKDNSEALILCSVGRLAEIKNFMTLIKAFKVVNEENKNIKLVIFGDGAERNRLEKIILKYDLAKDVFLPGFTNEVLLNIERCDIFILPSFFEGVSISLLEAMSVGLPVIASKVGGNIELIQHGANGFLFNPHNANELVGYINIIIHNNTLKNNFSKKSLEFFSKNYSIGIALNKYHDIYKMCSG